MKIKKAKYTKTCAITRKLKFEDYKSCLKVTQLENKINKSEKNEVNAHNRKEGFYKN